jgi:putative peptidoglycan lipid II flippase
VIWRFAVAAVIAGGIGFAGLQALGGANPGKFPVATIASSGITCLILGFVMALIYLALLRVLRVPEATSLVSNLTGAVKRIAGRK